MKRSFTTLMLVLFALAGFFHGSHIQYGQEIDFSTKQGYMTQYPRVPDVVVYPMTNFPF